MCVATYATAAVGVTLTAANRVFLMEPSEDPATELQAAGRIRRLGQTKEVLIKRFAFRNTIEHVIVDLHEEIKAKRVKAGAGQNDSTIRQLFKKHNLHKDPHVPDPTMAQDFATVPATLRKHVVECHTQQVPPLQACLRQQREEARQAADRRDGGQATLGAAECRAFRRDPLE